MHKIDYKTEPIQTNKRIETRAHASTCRFYNGSKHLSQIITMRAIVF